MFDPCSKNEDPACYEVPELIYDERLTCMHSCSVMSNPLQSHGLQSTKLLCSWISPSRNTGMGCHFLLQGIFPTQGLNSCLLPWQADSLPAEPQGSLNLTKNRRNHKRISALTLGVTSLSTSPSAHERLSVCLSLSLFLSSLMTRDKHPSEQATQVPL